MLKSKKVVFPEATKRREFIRLSGGGKFQSKAELDKTNRK